MAFKRLTVESFDERDKTPTSPQNGLLGPPSRPDVGRFGCSAGEPAAALPHRKPSTHHAVKSADDRAVPREVPFERVMPWFV